ncbi:MAG: hypothetical protein KDD61_09025 [Bdellovibrionales bacterium]|nr:hypothetical protein [Bdellovibrionales bacterium]
MDIASIKEDLTEKLTAIWDKVEEHPAYSRLLEAYDSLPAKGQKAVVIVSSLLLTYILLAIPLSFISSSQVSIEEFEETRHTIRELLKTTRLDTEGSSFRSGPAEDGLIGRVRSTISAQNFLPEQVGQIQPYDVSKLPLGPKTIEKFGVRAEVKTLNLNEIISLGYQLQQVTSGVKLIGMEMTASVKDPHYFDVIFKLVSFVLPADDEAEDGKKPPARGRSQRGK